MGCGADCAQPATTRRPTERPFDPTRDLTWASVQWMRPAAVRDWHEWALIHVVPIKDAAARAKATPTPLRRRQRGGPRGADRMCAYDALYAMWEERVQTVPLTERTFGTPSRTPLFVGADEVSPWSSTDSRRVVKAMAAAAGLDPEEFGGK
eukprot:6210674-Pleurochrysis_carterae.AAC.1